MSCIYLKKYTKQNGKDTVGYIYVKKKIEDVQFYAKSVFFLNETDRRTHLSVGYFDRSFIKYLVKIDYQPRNSSAPLLCAIYKHPFLFCIKEALIYISLIKVGEVLL